jgi:hypothetical protein
MLFKLDWNELLQMVLLLLLSDIGSNEFLRVALLVTSQCDGDNDLQS